MATNSSASGYLTPVDDSAADDQLDDILHDFITGVTGIAGDLVRPRWQHEPPQQPAFDVNWVAFGLNRVVSDTFAHVGQSAAGDGADVVSRDEILFYLHSFYGPQASRNVARLRDGIAISQNRAELYQASKLTVVEVQDPIKVPALLKEQWVPKIDVTVVYRRRVSRTYPVLKIQSGQMGLDNEHYMTLINVSP